ncbi:uncharacterized protein [Spinacia oleracea]|uniref:Uncharacterized protein isoform X2 n=1 Tax=Spinacia oleracea TaxID=3562 RepID=A0ABM3QI46_SPIOL|nr:uncharacterized protein LOC130459592 isoform X2 [Spinacia oleracea]
MDDIPVRQTPENGRHATVAEVIENPLLKQLKRTKAEITIWDLMCTSKEHREKLIRSLDLISVPTDITPDSLVSHVTRDAGEKAIVFTDKDLPKEGGAHNKALYLVVGCKGQNILLALVANGSAVNVCPLRTAHCLGLGNDDFQTSTQGVRAYDNSRRPVLGKINLSIQTGPVARTTEFQIIDIKPTFNLLLGRPWLHDLGGVASTLHQMVKLNHNGVILDIRAPPLDFNCTMVGTAETADDLYGFQMEETIQFIEDYDPAFLDPHASRVIPRMLLAQGYFPGTPLGIRKKECTFHPFPDKSTPFGLGYEPTEEDIADRLYRLRLNKAKQTTLLPPYQRTLNGMFVREGEEHPCCDFPEPFVQDGLLKPGFEIFHDCHTLDEAPHLTKTKIAEILDKPGSMDIV